MKTLSKDTVIRMAEVMLTYYRPNMKEVSLTKFREGFWARCDRFDCEGALRPTDEMLVDALRAIPTITLLGHATPKTTIVFHEI